MSGQYDDFVETGNNTASIQGLQSGSTYYFAVRACNSAKTICSEFSNEVSTSIAIPQPAPVASYTTNTTSGTAPLTILFTDTSSGAITGRTWQFGDGTSAANATFVTHTYTEPGSYTARFLVTGPGGSDTAVASTPIVVQAPDNGGNSGSGSDGSNDGNSGNGPASGASLIEAGEIKIDHTWRRVNFQQTFVDPVVIVKPLSANNHAPVVIRIDAVDASGFMVRVQEWDYLDGTHVQEDASYLVVERGVHQLPDGSWLEADLLNLNATNTAFKDITLNAAFTEIPVVLVSVETYNEADAVTTRLHNVDRFGLQIRLQEQEANPPQHMSETVAYIAWEPSAGIIDGLRFEVGRTQNEVTHAAHTIVYDTAFSTPPAFLADMQTTNGPDSANVRWLNKTAASVDVWVDEEQSGDMEVSHTLETIGYVSVEPAGADLAIETGEILINHTWKRVDFKKPFVDPIVVVKPLSFNGSDPSVIRVDAVDSQGFMVRVQEWDYRDGTHMSENASYLVVERGVHELADDSWLEAGTVTLGAYDGNFTNVPLNAPFNNLPVVITGVDTFHEADAVTTRLHNIDPQGFDVRLQEQEANLPSHAAETVAFIAVEPSVGIIDGQYFEVGYTGAEVTHKTSRIIYDSNFAAPPVFLADMQTTNGRDTASLRWQNKTALSVDVWVNEEQSKDAEMGHIEEVVGYLLFGN